MSLNTLQGSTVSNTARNSSESAKKILPEGSNTDTGFANLFSQAVDLVQSKSLSPEVLAATTPAATIQTSTYVFDPQCVVGQVPESNTFLQAIRAMLGNPVIETSSKAPTTQISSTSDIQQTPLAATLAAAPTPVTPSQLVASSATTLPTAAVVTQPSVSDALNAIEAQLSYQNIDPAPSTSMDPIKTASELVDQYIANSSAAAVSNIQSTLADSVTQEKQSA
jgi:hypothetical protein